MNIFALSSGIGPSGIAIIRVSGPDAIILAKSFNQNIDLKFKQINYCKLRDPKTNELIDEGLVLCFPKPDSYTGDNLVEFHVHGSNAVISYFLKILSNAKNCRLAEPGEFTKIAFHNKKIDLLEAESIGDLIHSETELQRLQAIKATQGNTSDQYNNLREKLIKSLAYIEAKIDFAEDDLPESVLKEAHKSISEVHLDIKKLLSDNKVGEKIREGFKVSLIGEVNAGKSSLLNLLSKREVAIVSEEEGTTRDVIETYLNIDGYPVILSDTAGIRSSENEVEKKGITLAINKSKQSDLNLIIVDNSSLMLSDQVKSLINSDAIIVLNKSDIKSKITHHFAQNETVLISVKEKKNIDLLVKKIKEKLSSKYIVTGDILITRERHRIKLNACLQQIESFIKKDHNKEIEMAAEDLRLATRHLGGLVGKVDVEEILGSIFKDFCIGK